MRIEKWEGTGNVYLLLDAGELGAPLTAAGAVALCDLRVGIGADGVLVLERQGARASMAIWNPDGSASEACGNGTRMAARWLAARAGTREVVIETVAGPLAATAHTDGTVTAAMAQAALAGPAYQPNGGSFPFEHRFVSIGNPHVTIAVPDPEAVPLDRIGPELEHHPWFPERTNVEIYRVRDERTVEMRVWERGVGETRACGSGACAVAVAAVLDGATERTVDVLLPGGTLRVAVGDDLSIRQTGPAGRILTAELDPAFVGRYLT